MRNAAMSIFPQLIQALLQAGAAIDDPDFTPDEYDRVQVRESLQGHKRRKGHR
jgi:hypothetical protein